MKKTLRVFIFVLLLAFGLVVAVNSCKKEEPDTDTQSSTDNSVCEGEFSRIFPHVNGIAVGDSGVQKGIYIPTPDNNCPDYYIDSADIADGFPVTMWLYFGTDTDGDGNYDIPCVSTDGKSRRGVIEAVFNSSWKYPPATVTMTLQNYFVKDIKGEIQYKGTVAITKNSPTTFTQVIQNGECVTADWTIKWNCNRTMNILVGDTANLNDDISTISGSADGVDRLGRAFNVDITSPLTRKMGCTYIVSGTQTIKIDGKKDRTVDYGDGTCDNRATLTIDGNVFEFILR
jgi:hypothetical protein